MANKNKHVIIAYFSDSDAADAAAHQIKDWDKANTDIKLGGIGILTWENGKIKTHKVGARAAGTGAKWGLALGAATGILTGGVTLIGGAIAGVAGGAVLGALFHKNLGLSDDDWGRLKSRLIKGGAALVIMGDEDEVEPTQLELAGLGGDVQNFQVPQETMTQVEAADKVELVDPDAVIVEASDAETADADVAEADVAEVDVAEVDVAEADAIAVEDLVVNVPGSWQSAYDADCGDWNAGCAGTYLSEQDDGTFTGAFAVPSGSYEAKVALHGSWDENYGEGGVPSGANYQFQVGENQSVTFSYDPESHLLTIV